VGDVAGPAPKDNQIPRAPAASVGSKRTGGVWSWALAGADRGGEEYATSRAVEPAAPPHPYIWRADLASATCTRGEQRGRRGRPVRRAGRSGPPPEHAHLVPAAAA